ncbi:hypothetical protein PRIPAC_70518 [Pristionchus pacificus]|uniref:Uncharacterized protein n=1 Tax=Pristionchus pacificus TaxID=54126 RepID=A0A2A6CR71_PRIPA|nr:hypothetical protein PRIPAC_70518 [Pristionchus pacificus]|eukprot:PDM80557.1 hypothetical protein PRIPAC_35560 [Pristionchus pacificus]
MEEEGKDSRKQRKLAEEKKNHHRGQVIVGPGVVVKRGGDNGEVDPFGVGCSDVPHSLNKDKRWEKVGRAEEILEDIDSDSTFIKASVPITSGRYLVPIPASIESVKSEKGGYTSVTTVRNGEVETREAKSDKSKLHMLVDSDPYASSSTTYTSITVRDGDPKTVERAWRSIQAYGCPKDIQRRTERKRDEKEWNDRRQDELEQRLEESYEEQMESNKPLSLPKKYTI